MTSSSKTPIQDVGTNPQKSAIGFIGTQDFNILGSSDGTSFPPAFSSAFSDFEQFYPGSLNINTFPDLNIVSYGLPQDPEQQSICFFMSKFVMDDRKEEIWGGSLEALPATYHQASPDSALSLATAATSMSSIAWNPECAHFKPGSLQKYVQSLRLINEAVQDPIESKSDNLLMAVLMLGFYEVRGLHLSAIIFFTNINFYPEC